MAISEILKVTADTMSLYLFVLITKVSLFYLVNPVEKKNIIIPNKLKKKNLQTELNKLNLDTSGNKSVLIERLERGLGSEYENIFFNNIYVLTQPYLESVSFSPTIPFTNINIPSELIAILLMTIIRQLLVSSFLANLITINININPNEMTVVELRQELKKRHLSTTGIKPKLIERLEKALKAEKIIPRDMSCVELREELKKRHLSTIGKKSILIERLEDNLDCDKKSRDLDDFYNSLKNIICEFRNCIFDSLKSSLQGMLNKRTTCLNNA